MQPSWPFGKGEEGRKAPPFFSVDSQPGILVAIVMGLQHALAMVGGIVTPPLLVYRVTVPEVLLLLLLYVHNTCLFTWNTSHFLHVIGEYLWGGTRPNECCVLHILLFLLRYHAFLYNVW